MIRLPPEITFEKRTLPDGGWSYDFRHHTLGTLGRILMRELSEGRARTSPTRGRATRPTR